MKPHAVRFRSGDRKSKKVIERERDHWKRFLLVASALFKYLMVKLKTFFGIFCCTLDQRKLVLGN